MQVGSIPGQGTKISHAMGQQSPGTTTPETTHPRAHEPQLPSAHSAIKTPCAATTTPYSQKNKCFFKKK